MKRDMLTMWVTIFSMGCIFGGALLMINSHVTLGLRAAIFGFTFGLAFLAADALIMFPYFPVPGVFIGWEGGWRWWLTLNVTATASVINHPKCACGNNTHPQLGAYCLDCWFNGAIEAVDGDYTLGQDGAIILHNGEPLRLRQ